MSAVVREVGKGVCERSEGTDRPKRPENTRKHRNFVCLRVRSVTVRRGNIVRVREHDRSVGQVSICPSVPLPRNLVDGGRNGDGFRTFEATASTEKNKKKFFSTTMDSKSPRPDEGACGVGGRARGREGGLRGVRSRRPPKKAGKTRKRRKFGGSPWPAGQR